MKFTTLKKLLLSITVFILTFATTITAQPIPQQNLKNIFSLDNYSIYSDEIIDTYIIASALYFNFESNLLMPMQDEQLYIDTKNYFEKYKDTEFIKNLGKYINLDEKTVNPYVIQNLILKNILYINDMGTQGYIPNPSFKDENEFEQFKTDLYNFYYDTDAHSFFEQHNQYYNSLQEYTKLNADKIPISNLLSTMESYVGNKDKYFKGSDINYMSFVTLFIPNNASFFTIGFNDSQNKSKIYLTSLQSPNPYSPTDLMKFDFNKIIEDLIHESLHTYINNGVAENNDLISELSQNKNTKDYCSSMYYNFPWNRIADENIVRAVETAIYKNVYNNEEQAINQILNKEVLNFNKNIKSLYDSLELYESDRNKYKTIDDYIPKLITTLFNN